MGKASNGNVKTTLDGHLRVERAPSKPRRVTETEKRNGKQKRA